MKAAIVTMTNTAELPTIALGAELLLCAGDDEPELKPDCVLLGFDVEIVPLELFTVLNVVAAEEAGVATPAATVATAGMPVMMPLESVSVRYEVKPLV